MAYKNLDGASGTARHLSWQRARRGKLKFSGKSLPVMLWCCDWTVIKLVVSVCTIANTKHTLNTILHLTSSIWYQMGAAEHSRSPVHQLGTRFLSFFLHSGQFILFVFIPTLFKNIPFLILLTHLVRWRFLYVTALYRLGLAHSLYVCFYFIFLCTLYDIYFHNNNKLIVDLTRLDYHRKTAYYCCAVVLGVWVGTGYFQDSEFGGVSQLMK